MTQCQWPDPAFVEAQKGAQAMNWSAHVWSTIQGVSSHEHLHCGVGRAHGGQQVWACNPGEVKKEGSSGCFEGGAAELGWAPAACLAWSPPTADNSEPCGSCYHQPPWITRRISPPFSPPADVLWLRFRKITTPILDTVDRSSRGTRSKEWICHALIKTNFPCTLNPMGCRVRNCPVSVSTARLGCHCALRVMATSPTPTYLYIL